MNYKIYMPLADGEKISNEVLNALNAQILPIDLYPITRKRNDYKRIISIVECRNVINMNINKEDGLVFLIDSDVIVGTNDLKDLLDYLNAHSETDLVSHFTARAPYEKRPEVDFFKMSCCCVRARKIADFHFNIPQGSEGEERQLTEKLNCCYCDERVLKEANRA